MQYLLKQRNLFLVSMVFVLSLAGCLSTAQKAKNFVDQYNKEAKINSSGIIKSTSAKLVSDKKIRILFQTYYAPNDDGIDFLKTSSTSLLTAALPNIKSVKTLFDEGVIFEYVLLASDNSIINSALVDKKAFDEISKVTEGGSNSKDDQLDKMMVILNKQLPYTDPSTGVKITKIFVEGNAVVYKSEMPDELAANFNGDESLKLMKAEIIKTGNLKRALSSMEVFNITKLIYRYYRTNGKLLAEIPVEKKDLRPN